MQNMNKFTCVWKKMNITEYRFLSNGVVHCLPIPFPYQFLSNDVEKIGFPPWQIFRNVLSIEPVIHMLYYIWYEVTMERSGVEWEQHTVYKLFTIYFTKTIAQNVSAGCILGQIKWFWNTWLDLLMCYACMNLCLYILFNTIYCIHCKTVFFIS